METTTGVIVFTQDDLNNAVANARTMVKSSIVDTIGGDIKTIFRGEVREGNMERDYATALYNTIAEKIGAATVTSIGGLYTVEVSYEGDVVMTIEDIEADNEDEATDKVSEDLEVDEVQISFVISHNGDYETVEAPYGSSYRIQEQLELSATEQD